MDQFLTASANLANILMPTVLLIVLIFVLILLYRMIVLFKTLNDTVAKTHKTIDLLDTSIEKLQKPLDTVAKISETVDKVHEAGITAVKQTKEYLSRNSKQIKDRITTTFKKKKNGENSAPIPSPEDIIKGE